MNLRHDTTRFLSACGAALILWCAWCQGAAAQNSTNAAKSEKGEPASRSPSDAKRTADDTPTNVLSSDEWKRVDAAVDRALNWMAAQQQEDGSFPSLETGQPAVTSLCMMAFISHGHSPGNGEFGARLERATDFVLSCQKESGILAKV
jgi:hypothetical protein